MNDTDDGTNGNTGVSTRASTWRRWLGIAAGLGTQVAFGFTVWYLFWFLRDGVLPPSPNRSALTSVLSLDVLLSLQFAVVHSLLLWPRTKAFVTRRLPTEFYGSLFCAATCLGLACMFWFWRGSPVELWHVEGRAASVIRTGFYASWVALFYSLSLTGLGYQTGWTQWWHWFRHRKLPRRQFVERGAYAWMRHPVYLSFLGLVWFTPHMSIDHAVLTGLWTVYLFFGSHLKDLRLEGFLGDVYRDYCTRVRGYPFVFFGPLGKHARLVTPHPAAVQLSDPPPRRRAA